MRASVVLARADDRPLDVSHPAYGAILDLGSYGRPAEPWDRATPEDWRGLVTSVDPGGERLELTELDGAPERERLEAGLDERALVLVVTDGESSLLAVAGGGLPSMGSVGSVDADVVVRSLELVAGRRASVEGTLFAEPTVSTAGEEERLRERLRQLYGEE
jgi:hypothetical protein